MNTPNKRLRYFRNKKGYTQKELAESIGLNQANIRDIESGKVTLSTLHALAIENIHHLKREWLLHGQGAMIESEYGKGGGDKIVETVYDTPIYNKVSDSEKIEPPNFSKPDPGEFDYVPLSDAQLSAGGGNFVLSESIVGHYSFKRSWLRRVATAKRNLILMLVKGDSMEPGVLHNDMVMIDQGRKDIRDGLIYAIRVDATVLIKRIQLIESQVRVFSDNPAYKPYTTRDRLAVIGQVIWYCRTLVHEEG